MDTQQLKEIETSVTTLNKGGILLYPTDTIWGLGCDCENQSAIEKIYFIKQRQQNNPLLCLVSDETMLERYVGTLSTTLRSLLYDSKNLTVIYPSASHICPMLKSSDGSMGFRIVKNGFCHDLIKSYDKALVSTSANISGSPFPTTFREIRPEIIEQTDYSVNWMRKDVFASPSKVVKLKKDGEFEIIRE